jgi:hypothetical protein
MPAAFVAAANIVVLICFSGCLRWILRAPWCCWFFCHDVPLCGCSCSAAYSCWCCACYCSLSAALVAAPMSFCVAAYSCCIVAALAQCGCGWVCCLQVTLRLPYRWWCCANAAYSCRLLLRLPLAPCWPFVLPVAFRYFVGASHSCDRLTGTSVPLRLAVCWVCCLQVTLRLPYRFVLFRGSTPGIHSCNLLSGGHLDRTHSVVWCLFLSGKAVYSTVVVVIVVACARPRDLKVSTTSWLSRI